MEEVTTDCAFCGEEITVPKILVDDSPGGVLCERCTGIFLSEEAKRVFTDKGDFDERG